MHVKVPMGSFIYSKWLRLVSLSSDNAMTLNQEGSSSTTPLPRALHPSPPQPLRNKAIPTRLQPSFAAATRIMPDKGGVSGGAQQTGDKAAGAANFLTSTVGNTVGGLSRTVGNVTGAATRGVGDTVTGVTGDVGKPLGDAIGSLGTGVEGGVDSLAKGVEDAGNWKNEK